MKVLHTSDWHLGRSLYGRKRHQEFSDFLSWLGETIRQESIDVLLIAGDIFDTGTPSNRSQELYYQFLCETSQSSCRHVVVIAGNHDSPSFLDAPKQLLRAFNVHVVGEPGETPEEEVILLRDSQNKPEALICAVPYLREKDLRKVSPGETLTEKSEKLMQGLREHYEAVYRAAEQKRAGLQTESSANIPILGMGHLFAAGGKTAEGDGVRELYVGAEARAGADLFPSAMDYLALGHLHLPQIVGERETIRYCGSPIPMGFGEAGGRKIVLSIEFQETEPKIQEIEIPCFQKLKKISGSLENIRESLIHLKKEDIWVEIEYTGAEPLPHLRDLVEEMLAESSVEVLRIKDRQITRRILRAENEKETLEDLSESEVFSRCMDTFDFSEEERIEMREAHDEILRFMHDEDPEAR